MRATTMRAVDAKHYLLWAEILWDKVEDPDRYPFALPVVRQTTRLTLHPKVTFLVGENGSGKSTLLEALAVAWGFNPEGGSRNFRFSTRASHSDLHRALRLARGPRRAKDGFFLRAESYFNVATQVDDLGYPKEPLTSPYGARSLHEQSHGESFFALIDNRFRGGGLYILDEPEAALSPSRQIALLARIHELAGRGSQFVIATHSPIVMSYPDAWIYLCGDKGLDRVDYEETEHFQVTRDFLARRESVLRMLMEGDSRHPEED